MLNVPCVKKIPLSLFLELILMVCADVASVWRFSVLYEQWVRKIARLFYALNNDKIDKQNAP